MQVDTSSFRTDQDNHYDTKLYTVSGLESYIDSQGYPRLQTESPNVYAKAIKNKLGKAMSSGLHFRFYIKTDPNKNIFNPTDTSPVLDKQQHSFLNKVCKTEYTFSEVSENIFNQYIDFLKSKNTKLLHSAQRALK